MPATYWTFRRLGVLDQLKGSTFVKKYSVQFANEWGKESQPFYFFEDNPHECSQTWQVLRSEFDRMLLENARKHGAEVVEGTRVLDVLFADDRAYGVRVQNPDGSKEDIIAKVVVDASGQSSLIAQRLQLRQPDPVLRKASIWTYYTGAQRDPDLDEGATLVLRTEQRKGWFWYLPLANDVVSVGVVSSIDYLFRDRGDHETIFYEEVERCPAVKKRLAPGKRTAGFYATKDFSYRSSRAAGHGWVVIGDAFGFLDPIYSSGVFLALKSGEWAADAIVEANANDDFSEQRLGSWAPTFLKGMERIKRLVYAFYDGFSFGQFIRHYPQYKRHIVDLLVGDVFKDSLDDVFPAMEESSQMQNRN
ncbi:MAG: alkylhalidase [Gemmatales bacterium]|nr:MAG: alkylhalidase [Gemmatales bacterium]